MVSWFVAKRKQPKKAIKSDWMPFGRSKGTCTYMYEFINVIAEHLNKGNTANSFCVCQPEINMVAWQW